MSFEVGDSRETLAYFYFMLRVPYFEQIKSALPPSHLGIVQINLLSALGLASVQLVAPRQTCLRGALLFIRGCRI